MTKQTKQHGLALITVLMVVALASVIALTMTERLQTLMQRTMAVNTLSGAKWVNIGAEGFAINVLKQDFKDSPSKTHLEQYWASGEAVFPVGDSGMFTGELKDLNGCFNLNGVQISATKDTNQNPSEREKTVKQFIALIESYEIDTYQAEIMADSLFDWLDKDSIVNYSSGAEDSEYSGNIYPYVAANSPLADLGELRAIKGFSQENIEKILPAVCVIPAETKMLINVNTVEEAAIFVGIFEPNLTLDQAQSLISERPEDGWNSVAEMLSSSTLSGIEVSTAVKEQLIVISEYFMLQAETQSESGTNLYTESILKKHNKEWLVIGRRFGGKIERIPDPETAEQF